MSTSIHNSRSYLHCKTGTRAYDGDRRAVVWCCRLLWMGHRTQSGLHYDYADNVIVQVYGCKRAILVAPKYTRRLHPLSSIRHQRAHVSSGRLGLDAVCPTEPAELYPGDVLFIPKTWWHQIDSVGTAISVNAWHGAPMGTTEHGRMLLRSGWRVLARIAADFVMLGMLRQRYTHRLYSSPPLGLQLWNSSVETGVSHCGGKATSGTHDCGTSAATLSNRWGSAPCLRTARQEPSGRRRRPELLTSKLPNKRGGALQLQRAESKPGSRHRCTQKWRRSTCGCGARLCARFGSVTHCITVESPGAGCQTIVNRSRLESIGVPRAIGAPLLRDSWLAVDAPSNTSRHRRAQTPGMEPRNAQRFAIDWVRMACRERTFHGAGDASTCYAAYGEPVLAVADGTVSAAIDGAPDNVPRRMPRELTADTAPGNHVVVDIGRGAGVFYGHLQLGSVSVRQGQRVTRGHSLGRVGNSGRSSEPHLHMHVMDGPDWLTADGVPYVFDGIQISGINSTSLPTTGQIVGF